LHLRLESPNAFLKCSIDRRITLWHQSGVPARELAERAGHLKPSMSLDVYSHVMPADEVPVERATALIGEGT
jgi:hypothetical protein